MNFSLTRDIIIIIGFIVSQLQTLVLYVIVAMLFIKKLI